MSIVFCGKTALWLWRSPVAVGAALGPERTRDVLAGAGAGSVEIDEAVWKVNSLCGRRWCGQGKVEVCTGSSTRKFRTRTLVRLPRRGVVLYPVSDADGLYVVSPGDALLDASEGLDVEQCALLGLELCGTYGCVPDMKVDTFSRYGARTTRAELEDVLIRSGASKTSVYAEALEYIADGSASPMESKLYLLFCMPRKRGGMGLPKPRINIWVPLGPDASALADGSVLRPDFLWPESRQIIEYDSTRFHFDLGDGKAIAQQTKRDRRRLNALQREGYQVWSMTSNDIASLVSFERFIEPLAHRLCPRRKSVGRHTSTLMRDVFDRVIRMSDPMAGVFNCR